MKCIYAGLVLLLCCVLAGCEAKAFCWDYSSSAPVYTASLTEQDIMVRTIASSPSGSTQVITGSGSITLDGKDYDVTGKKITVRTVKSEDGEQSFIDIEDID